MQRGKYKRTGKHRALMRKLMHERSKWFVPPMLGRHHRAATRKKISVANTGQFAGRLNPMFGVHRYGKKAPGYRHGLSKTPFAQRWHNMHVRCYYKKTPGYKNYGGRGITVCERWHEFENFRDDLYKSFLKHVKQYGLRQTTLERVNNDESYKLSNCRWATCKEQSNNKRKYGSNC